ncbi:MAG: 3-hydroxybutyryl-CoA dehydrogenase [Euryarchaeota archaeon]|nr:3-hydroxybutyryl-CoA dehydrogenase [Euryarchaeota archaeon]|tara:strand:+ start:1764 stop:2660 length:897 start_codon:yes stop_codon:yes gene_type:complete
MDDNVIRVVGVIGAGTMGAGIAQVCSQVGWEVRLYDALPGGVEAGILRIEEFWSKGIKKGRTDANLVEKWRTNIVSSSLEDAVVRSDLVIEAVPEKIELKNEIFESLDSLAGQDTVLATNTSSLSVKEISKSTQKPERVVGMHFFNPVPLMPLVEIIRHDRISKRTVNIAEYAAERMGKSSIIVNDVPGFATSRLGVVLGNEAIRMLAEGVASASDIDTAMKLGYRHPMGPLELSDLVGLDVRRDILNGLAESFGDDSYRPHTLLNQLVNAGDLGRKTGRGIYEWDNGEKLDRDDLGL